MESSNRSHQFRIPRSMNFSFSIPEILKHNNPFVLRWIDNLPGPVKRDEPLEPARIQPPKRTLDEMEMDDPLLDDGHRDKRTRISSALSNHRPVKRHSRLSAYGHGLMHRLSSACRRVSISKKHEDRPESPLARVSLSPPGSPATLVERPRMRFVFVGDSGCGKSSLLLRYYRNLFNPCYTKTKYELFDKTTTVDGQDVDLELWDTSGDISLHQLQLLSYLAWDAVFLCFSMDSSADFNKTQQKWVDEIHKYCGDIPFILLGLKKDARARPGVRGPFYPNLNLQARAAKESSEANIVRGVKYLECSAKTGENVNLVFEEGVRMVLYERDEQEALAQLQAKYDEMDLSGFAGKMCFK